MSSAVPLAAAEASGVVLDSYFTIEFWESVFSELLFVAVLVAAYAIGKYQSQSTQKKAAKWNKQKFDIPISVQKHGSQSYECGERARVQQGAATTNASATSWRQRQGSDARTAPSALLGGDAKVTARRPGRESQGAGTAIDTQGHLALKNAIRQRDFDEVLQQFVSLHDSSLPDRVSDGIPQSLREAAVQMASQFGKFGILMDSLRASKVSTRTLNAMLKDCAQRGNLEDLQACRQYGYEMKISFNCASYSILLEGLETSQEACALFEEASSSGVRMGRLCEVAAERAEKNGDSTLADLVVQHLPTGVAASPATVAAILSQHAEAVRRDHLGMASTRSESTAAAVDAAVLNLYEAQFSNVDITKSHQTGCDRAHQIVLDAALRAGRDEVVAKLVGPEGGAAAAVRAAADSVEAMRIFEVCPKTACLYQVLLEVLLGHGDVKTGEKVLEDAARGGVAEAPLYLSVAEAQLRCGAFQKARGTLAAMRAAGFQPTIKVLNVLLESTLKGGSKDIWSSVREMEEYIKPDSGTCRVLLEHGQKMPEYFAKVVALAERIDDLSDVFGLLLETLLRNNCAKLLVSILKRQRGPNKLVVKDAITYAHLVRAYGAVEDIDGAWDAWREMLSRNMLPLKVTLGCMVQALVANRQPDAGYALVCEMRSDPRTSGLVNSITCNSLIKGFGYDKSFDRAWTVFCEMKDAKMELTTMTFNTLIDACARSNEMGRLPSILEDMKTHGIELDQVSYNTIIKGLCHEKRLDEALELREKMRAGGTHAVDAHAYGALLDGCSRLGKYQLGFDLLEEMLQEGVVPNNITLTSLVRLAGYSHQRWALDKAFDLCDDLSRTHRIRLNWHVYKNLSKACVAHGEPKRALVAIAQAIKAGLKCDEDAYGTIILALAAERETLSDAVCVLRLAAGLCVRRSIVPAPLADLSSQSLCAHGGVSAQFATSALNAIAVLDQALAVTLVVELERGAGLQLDRHAKLRLASAAPAAQTPEKKTQTMQRRDSLVAK